MRVYKRTSVDEFLERYTTKNPDGCWLWTGPIDKDGYARLYFDGRQVRAHRVVLERSLGRSLGPGMFACHLCDVRACVNPSHLWEGTHYENDQDALEKGRIAHGARHYNAKLTERDVREIRELISRGSSQRAVAKSFGVTQSNISHIIRGARWAHVHVNAPPAVK